MFVSTHSRVCTHIYMFTYTCVYMNICTSHTNFFLVNFLYKQNLAKLFLRTLQGTLRSKQIGIQAFRAYGQSDFPLVTVLESPGTLTVLIHPWV